MVKNVILRVIIFFLIIFSSWWHALCGSKKNTMRTKNSLFTNITRFVFDYFEFITSDFFGGVPGSRLKNHHVRLNLSDVSVTFDSFCHFLSCRFFHHKTKQIIIFFFPMNDPHYRFLYLLLLYLQYVIYNNKTSISVLFFTFTHIIRQEAQVAALKRNLKVRIK